MTHPTVIARPIEPMPEWLRIAAKDARLRATDLAPLFGYAAPVGILHAVAAGHFPEPDGAIRGDVWSSKTTAKRWKKATVVAEYRRRLALTDPLQIRLQKTAKST